MEKETFQLSEQLAEETRRNGRIAAVAIPIWLALVLFFVRSSSGLPPTTFMAIDIAIIVIMILLVAFGWRRSMAQQNDLFAQFHVTLTEEGIERHNKGTAEFFPYTDIRQIITYRQRNGAISYLSLKSNRVWLTFWRLHDLKRLATLLEERVPQQATRQTKQVYVDWQHPLATIFLMVVVALFIILFRALFQEPSALNLLFSSYMAIYGVYLFIQRPLSRVWGSSMRGREDFQAALGLIFITLTLCHASILINHVRTDPCHSWNRYVGQSSCVASFQAHESVAFLPDQHTLVLGHLGGISFQPIRKRLFYRSPILRPQGLFRQFAMTPDGQQLASVSWDDASEDDLVELWDLSTHTLFHEEAIPFSRIEAMYLHPNQPIIALSGWGDAEVEGGLWSTVNWQPISPITHTVVAFSPDGTLFATRGQEESAAVQLWQLADWTPSQTLRLAEGRQPYISQAVFSQDGQWLAAKGSDNLHLWHLASGENLFNWFTGVNLTAPAFSPTQPILAVGQEIVQDQHEIALWSLTDGALLATIPLGKQRPSSLSFSSDGALLAVGTYSKAMVFQMDRVLP